MRLKLNIPIIVEELPAISISDLKRLRLIEGDTMYRSSPILIQAGDDIYRIRVTVNMSTLENYCELSYIVSRHEIKIKMPLIHVPNATGKGANCYFVCPASGKKCKKLYFYNNVFGAKSLIPNWFYYQQTLPKSRRGEYVFLKRIQKLSDTAAGASRKWHKRHYGGKHTQNQNRILEAQRSLKQIAT